MDFDLTEDQEHIRSAVRMLASEFEDEYWLVHDRDAAFPWEFYRAFAEGSWFGVAVPDAGTDTTRIMTSARREGDEYVIHGHKIWISKAVAADAIVLTRTTPLDEVERPTDGMTLFLADMAPDAIEVRPIEKLGRNAVASNEVYIDGFRVPVERRIGDEGRGFWYLLDGLNPERILLAHEAIGIGHAALRRAVAYANDRVVFDRPIGMNQGHQDPACRGTRAARCRRTHCSESRVALRLRA